MTAGGDAPGLTQIRLRSRSSRGTEILSARDETGRSVIVKRLGVGADPVEGLRLLAEGRLLGRFGGCHHLARCLAILDDPPGLVLEPAGGSSLADRIDRGSRPLAIGGATTIILQVADAVRWLHEHGVVHRDVKCSNVMLDSRNGATLIDLGVAVGGGFERPWIDERIGTLGYCPPELLRDPTLDLPTIDVYGLAASLYECVSGHLPHDFPPGETEAELGARIAADAPPVPLGARLSVPAGFAAVVDRGLAPAAADRYPTAAAFAEALGRFAGTS